MAECPKSETNIPESDCNVPTGQLVRKHSSNNVINMKREAVLGMGKGGNLATKHCRIKKREGNKTIRAREYVSLPSPHGPALSVVSCDLLQFALMVSSVPDVPKC
jgi:hypothetical protein